MQRHVMLGNPSDVGHAMTLADSTDSAMWFSGLGSGRCIGFHLTPSIFAKTTVDNEVIVDMPPWNWELLLLLLMGLVESVTCVTRLAT